MFQTVKNLLYSERCTPRTGVPYIQEHAPPYDPTVGLCLGSEGGGRFLMGEVPMYSRSPATRTRINVAGKALVGQSGVILAAVCKLATGIHSYDRVNLIRPQALVVLQKPLV